MEKGDTDLSRFLKDKAASEEGITPELILYYWNEMLLAVKSIHDNSKLSLFTLILFIDINYDVI